MFGQTFYFDTLRKYVMLVGTLFNDITILRYSDATKTITEAVKVPITYAPKDKMLARVIQDPDITKQTAISLPIISFEMGDMRYDGSRKLPSIGKSTVKNSSSVFSYQYNPVPYNINFKIYVYVKNAEDGTKIVEQIVPFFTPDWTTSVILIPEMNITMDIPLILNSSVVLKDTFDEKMTESRALVWELDFTLKGYLYGPVKSGPVIKFTTTNFYVPDVPDHQLATAVGHTPISEKMTIQPGLTANGQPTSNISLTIPYQEIEANSDFGYIEEIISENGLT